MFKHLFIHRRICHIEELRSKKLGTTITGNIANREEFSTQKTTYWEDERWIKSDFEVEKIESKWEHKVN